MHACTPFSRLIWCSTALIFALATSVLVELRLELC